MDQKKRSKASLSHSLGSEVDKKKSSIAEFAKLYKSTNETTEKYVKTSEMISIAKENINISKRGKNKSHGSETVQENVENNFIDDSRTRKLKKKNRHLDISKIANLEACNSHNISHDLINESKITSTPIQGKHSKSSELLPKKPIIKSIQSSPDDSDVNYSYPEFKAKKRNKSVSFALEDNEELIIKKSKSEESSPVLKTKNKSKKFKKHKHDRTNASDDSKEAVTNDNSAITVKKDKKKKHKHALEDMDVVNISTDEPNFKKVKKNKPATLADDDKPIENNEQIDTVSVEKKHKKKHKKSHNSTDQTKDSKMSEDRTVNEVKLIAESKSITAEAQNINLLEDATEKKYKNKKNKKPKVESIAENIANLSIGDNPFTLSNLIDEMKVVDKKPKNKQKQTKIDDNKNEKPDKNKKGKKKNNRPKDLNLYQEDSNPQDKDLSLEDKDENPEQEEKIKSKKDDVIWKKRKWNKDKKADFNEEILENTVIVDSIPLKYILIYRKVLTDHFIKYGLIRKVGIAEMYPTEEQKPVFTTVIQFYSEGAATQALEEDNMLLEDLHRIRVHRPLPPTQTTLVVRSYRGCSEQSMTSIFTACGKIRSIREISKGSKGSISTAFVEFDGPDAVERAIKVAEDAKIGGKKIYVSRFEFRKKKNQASKDTKEKMEESSDEGAK